MTILHWLFGSSPKRRKKTAKKKALKKAKGVVKRTGVRHFVIYDGDTDKMLDSVSGKTEHQAFKHWALTHKEASETARIISKRRWDTNT